MPPQRNIILIYKIRYPRILFHFNFQRLHLSQQSVCSSRPSKLTWTAENPDILSLVHLAKSARRRGGKPRTSTLVYDTKEKTTLLTAYEHIEFMGPFHSNEASLSWSHLTFFPSPLTHEMIIDEFFNDFFIALTIDQVMNKQVGIPV